MDYNKISSEKERRIPKVKTDMQKRLEKDFSKETRKELNKRKIIVNMRSENPNGYSDYNLIDTKESKSYFRNYKQIENLEF